ncbi:MAG: hypothetical protein DMD54_00415 [Gemmatimonadetes bacterium]|nr:MAG: hypothetical protein DMD54_00415 [Gemmatimonadota bacterium]
MATPMLDDLKRGYRLGWWALFLRGLLSLAVGVLIFARPLDSVAAFALVIAFWAIFTGLTTTVHAFELRSVAPHWWVLLLSGLVSVAFGVAAFYYYPGLSLTFAVVMVAWWLTVTGAIGIYAAVQENRLGLNWGWTAAFGVLSAAAGVFAIAAPPITLAAIMGLIAGFAIVSGVALIMGAFKVRSVVQSATSRAHAGMTA